MSRTGWVVVLGIVVGAVAFGLGFGVVAADGTDTVDSIETVESTDATGLLDSDGSHESSHDDRVTSLDQPQQSIAQDDIDADSLEMEITLAEDGSADWRVIYRLDLDSEEEIQGFEDLQADIEANESSYLDSFENRIRRTAESAANATQREMSIENVSMQTERTVQPDTEFGEVVYQFDWAGFATVEEDTVRAGDALDSLFLDEDTRLTLRWGSDYELDTHVPRTATVAQQRLTWRGPLDFDRGEPRIVLVTHEEQASEATQFPWGAVLLALLAVGAIAVAAVLYLSRQRTEPSGGPADDETAEEPETDAPPSELLSNEERVLKLVEENGGRIKQKKVAETFDWSAAMTSQVVGTLRETDQIETFRIGRENVLTLPDVDIVPNQEGNAASEDADADGEETR